MKAPSHEEIFSVTDDDSFEKMALEIFRFQAAGCPVYREYISLLGINPEKVDSIFSIPFMPISFFRDHDVITSGRPDFIPAAPGPAAGRIFLSSGTTGVKQSRHHVRFPEIYDASLERTFRHFYGDPAKYAIMGLLPSYLEREGSSLVYMVNRLIQLSGNDAGGFFLHDQEALFRSIGRARIAGLQVLLIGVTFALLDLAEEHPCDLSDIIIMETGGMKGRRKEIIREEVHDIIMKAFGVTGVHSEYGMTELLTQSYSQGAGVFRTPPWMKVLIRDSHDPMSHSADEGSSGGISVIDLANIWSCSFIATADLGRMHAGGSFEVLGRYDNADIRGCSLLAGNDLV
ncbi:MAG: acyl transferase [Bacteroidetes bacterium]|nr:MAG: acyl transferase [Bacteroidota bacterium]